MIGEKNTGFNEGLRQSNILHLIILLNIPACKAIPGSGGMKPTEILKTEKLAATHIWWDISVGHFSVR